MVATPWLLTIATVALVALVSILSGGLGTYKKGWIALKNLNLNINALMSIAVTGAVLIGQWPEAAMVMVLFTLAELIEAHSLDRARNAIGSLMQLTPDTATVQLASDQCLHDVKVAFANGRRALYPALDLCRHRGLRIQPLPSRETKEAMAAQRDTGAGVLSRED